MGNTTRREPVTSKIPASPDYKFLNITDFRGIHQTDNPFLASTNTASDCLNVYVDENNALTTRPRIEKILDASSTVGEVLFVYPLHKKQIYHTKKDGVVKFYVHKDDVFTEIRHDLSTSISEEMCAVLEHKDNFYIMSKDNYYVVVPYNGYYMSEVKNHSDTYIPTVETNTITSQGIGTGNPRDSYNLLSNKYKIDYVWDMMSNPAKATIGAVKIENKYVNIIPYTPLVGETIYLSEKKYITYTSTKAQKWTFTTEGVVLEDEVDVVSPNKFSPNAESYMRVGVDESGYLREVVLYNYNDTIPVKTETVGESTENIKDAYLTDNQNSFIVLLTKSINETTDRERIVLYSKDSFGEYVEKELYSKEVSWETDPHIAMKINSQANAVLVYPDGGGSKNCVILSDITTDYHITTEIEIPTFEKISNNFIIGDNISSVFVVIDDNTYYSYSDGSASFVEVVYNTPSAGPHGAFVNLEQNIILSTSTIGHPSVKKILGIDTSKHEVYTIAEIPLESGSTSSGVVYPDMSIHYNANNNITYLAPSTKALYSVTYESDNASFKYGFNHVIRFQNNWWFYGNKNLVYWTVNNNPTYITEDTKKILGVDDEIIIDALLADSSTLAFLKKDKWFVTTYTTIDDISTEIFIEAKSNIGAVSRAGIVSPYKEIPLYVNENGIYGLSQIENVQSSDQVSQMVSSYIEPMFRKTKDKDKIFSSTYLYWTYFFVPHEDNTDMYVLDDRTLSWYFWNIPTRLASSWYEDEILYLVDYRGVLYKFTTEDIIKDYATEYYDDGEKIIPWFWRSQIMSMGTINYSKKLSTTTFIMTDTDETDEYGLNYKFKIFRKLANESNTTTITNKLNYILSVTKKTIIPRFNFLQFELSNIDDDYDNNKLRLVGLGLKYELLAGLM